MADLLLHQFPISHYCEKIRWVLEHKQLPYTVKNQFPGVHMLVNRRLVGRGSVPLLVDGHHAVGNSSDIALYLEDQFPNVRLIPSSGEERVRVLALEAEFDEQAGPAVRRFVYSFVTPRPRLFKQIFFAGYSGAVRALGEVAGAVVARQVAAMYRVGPNSAGEAKRAIDAACDRLEELLEGDAERYLVGDTLSLADVTAASLLGPLVAPPGSPWTMEHDIPELLALRASLRTRLAGRWVLARYARDRRRSSIGA